MGGSKAADTNRPSNILFLSPDSHIWAESHRAEALELGFLVPQGVDPATVPVHLLRGVVLLDDQGGQVAA